MLPLQLEFHVLQIFNASVEVALMVFAKMKEANVAAHHLPKSVI